MFKVYDRESISVPAKEGEISRVYREELNKTGDADAAAKLAEAHCKRMNVLHMARAM